jgi:hypothetical protein
MINRSQLLLIKSIADLIFVEQHHLIRQVSEWLRKLFLIRRTNLFWLGFLALFFDPGQRRLVAMTQFSLFLGNFRIMSFVPVMMMVMAAPTRMKRED